MTSENIMLYFRNNFIYSFIINVAILCSITLFSTKYESNIFIYGIVVFYGVQVLLSGLRVYLSIKHRKLLTHKIKKFFKYLSINVLIKLFESIVYVIAAYQIYKVEGFQFVISFIILTIFIIRFSFSIVSSIVTMNENILFMKNERHIPKEFKNFLTDNTISLSYLVVYDETDNLYIDGNIEIKEYFMYRQRKSEKSKFAVYYNGKIYNIDLLNIYINDNNKKFLELSDIELHPFELKPKEDIMNYYK